LKIECCAHVVACVSTPVGEAVSEPGDGDGVDRSTVYRPLKGITVILSKIDWLCQTLSIRQRWCDWIKLSRASDRLSHVNLEAEHE